MRTVGAYEAKTHLSHLLEEVAKGERIIITRHGVPVAMLMPPPELDREKVADAIEKWRKYRAQQNITLGPGTTIKELIEEGRRF